MAREDTVITAQLERDLRRPALDRTINYQRLTLILTAVALTIYNHMCSTDVSGNGRPRVGIQFGGDFESTGVLLHFYH